MSGAVLDYTINYNLEIPNFDFPNWHTYYARNFKTVDGLLYLLTGITSVRGAWLNSTLYIVGDRVIDPDNSSAYECLIEHTSNASGSLADDIAAHPTYWRLADLVPTSRGAWSSDATQYHKNEFVSHEVGFYVCLETHVSTAGLGGFATDLSAGKWAILLDFQTAVDYATKIDGAISGGIGGYSAKAWAVGGVGTETNSAQYWAGVAQTAVTDLTTALKFKGTWSLPPGAVLPGGGVAQTGWTYRCTGTTTSAFGQVFNAGDMIAAIVDNASTSVFTGNWIKIEGTMTSGEITAALGFLPLNPSNNLSELIPGIALTNLGLTTNSKSFVTAANYAAMRTLLSVESIDEAAVYNSYSNGPTGTNTANPGVMMGLAGSITPAKSSRVRFVISASMLGGSNGSCVVGCRYGTGTAPVNGAAATGTLISGLRTIGLTAGLYQPVNVGGIITGLTPGTAYWFDLSIFTNAGITASPANIELTAFEL